jgi:hypothetical protein
MTQFLLRTHAPIVRVEVYLFVDSAGSKLTWSRKYVHLRVTLMRCAKSGHALLRTRNIYQAMRLGIRRVMMHSDRLLLNKAKTTSSMLTVYATRQSTMKVALAPFVLFALPSVSVYLLAHSSSNEALAVTTSPNKV